jgi:hypothetical protein
MKRILLLVPTLLLACACSGSGGGPSPIPIQEAEPNDSAATAGTMSLGGSARGALTALGDDDWWKLSLSAGDVISIEVLAQRLDQQGWAGNGNSMRLGLYAPDGTTRLLLQGSVPFSWAPRQDTDV